MTTPADWSIKDQVAYERAAVIRSWNPDYKAILAAVDYIISKYKQNAHLLGFFEFTITKSQVREAVIIDDSYQTWFVIVHILSSKIGQRIRADSQLTTLVLPYPILEWNDRYGNFEQQLFFDKEKEERTNQKLKDENRQLKEELKKRRAVQVAEVEKRRLEMKPK